ncbi:MAG: hypothetical protein A2898_03740 [Candidatus Kerfeldbacteria bacterium RIFCSPLOWO2_01_FULL_48_11]|uniref:Major facilitator superfamily (MFS) profile domain-containing protein n=1 Tax=Candidatus Kerfeldbacteria bacterium RIFCSPLOWO2_01_FULL_48_11 TaxID=1798543 RepID=A0A1G2B6K3_9BACT|nr:MAG: hypothetical protein A2898_03740 [Candidatus Kerfeldbacteria bacterium RIFCSPLOWO2_01_FULL_48_11]HCM68391.1 hypothetical protein [Candidatus Kerfeldbacteria bacterium]
MMHSHPRHKIEYTLRREVNELYATVTLKHIAFSMITIFEPIYLYIYFHERILPVLFYFGLIFLGFALIVPFAGKMLSRMGIKHSILISVFFAIIYFLGLNSLGTNHWMLYVLPLVSIFYKFYFWPAFHLDFARFSQRDRRARQVSIVNMISLATGILGPLAGGLVIAFWGYHALFIIVVLLLFTSIIPLFLSQEVYAPFDFSLKRFFQFIATPSLRRTEIALAAWGNEELISTLVWPIFMYLLIFDTSVIGGITSAATVVAFLSAYWIGRLADKVGKKKILRIGASLLSLAWVVKSIVRLPLHIGFADGFYKLSQEGAYISFASVIYDQASKDESQTVSVVLMREIILNFAKFAGVLVIGALVTLTGSLIPAFIDAAVSSLFFMFL